MRRSLGNGAGDDACRIVGIVNITEDSFSDGGCYLDSESALDHARSLGTSGAHLIELGAASSHPDSRPVEASIERDRLREPLEALVGAEGIFAV